MLVLPKFEHPRSTLNLVPSTEQMKQCLSESNQNGDAPAAIGPYSQTIQVGPTLYMSGQIGLDPVTGEFAGNSLETQTKQVLQNMKAVLSGRA